jgi:diguanylate cyclase (GGDEF)-like protein
MAANPRSKRVDKGTVGSLAELVAAGVVVLDPDGSARYANPMWTSLTGQVAPAWHGTGWLDVLAPHERADRKDELLATTRGGETWSGEWFAPCTPAGGRRLGVVAVPDHAGPDLETIVVTVTDTTVDQARRDPLTGLPDRGLFREFVAHAVDAQQRDPARLAAVLFIDVDDLKATNDAFGHEAGDRLLQAVARRIDAAVRPTDVVARYGGDEFTVLCQDLEDEAQAEAITERVRAAIHQPYDGHGPCRASVGLAIAGTPSSDPDGLVSEADRAMYRAKHHHPDSPSIDGVDAGHQLDVLAVATHELRSPLTALLGAAELLDGWRNQLMTDVDAAVGIVGRQAARLAGIIDDVLELDRSRHATDPPVPIPVGSVIDQALLDAPPPAHAELAIRVIGDAGHQLEALADRVRLTRVLVNLLTNAYRYGGTSIMVTGRRLGERVLIEVEDDGDGVPAHLVPDLFAPFSRGANRVDGRSEPSGNGLGLAIAQQALRSIGGDLHHTGVEPRGARFTITLPAVTAGAAS